MYKRIIVLISGILVTILHLYPLQASAVDFEILEPALASSNDKVISLDWRRVVNNDPYDLNVDRITKDTTVLLKLENFNYLHFKPTVSVSSTKIEAASFIFGLIDQIAQADLSALINQFLSQGFAPAQLTSFDSDGCTVISSSDLTAKNWALALNGIYLHTKKGFGVQNNSSAISKIDSSRLDIQRKCVDQLRDFAHKIKEKLGQDFLNRANNGYDQVIPHHERISQAATQFLNLAKNTLNGGFHVIGKFEAGVAIEVLISAEGQPSVDLNYVAERRASLSYLTQSTIPLRLHAGLTYSELRELDNETLLSLDGTLVQNQIVEGDESLNLSLFASLPIDGKPLDEANWFAGLGTDVTDIGDNIYIGLSYKFRDNFFVTAGAVYGETAEIETMMMEGQVTEPETNLVEIIRQDRQFEPFIALSYRFF